MRYPLLILLVSIMPYAQAGAPEWVQDSKRHIVSGDIVHWGTGTDASPDVAIFKAKQMAIKAIIEECGGFAHKDISPRKVYAEGNQAWALMSVPFQSCEYGKLKNPDKRLENSKIQESQKLYDEVIRSDALGPQQVDQEGVERRVYEWVAKQQDEFLSKIQADQDSDTHDVNALRREVELLRAEVHQQPLPPYKVKVVSSQKEMCWREYQQLLTQANMKAGDYYGNLAHPAVVEYFNQSEAKKALCLQMR